MNIFKEVYKESIIEKSKLSANQIEQVRSLIEKMSENGDMSSTIIEALQNKFPAKLGVRWKAERAFWTEKKRLDSLDIKDKAESLDFEKFRILPNTGACELCETLSGHGRKIFSKADLFYKGRPIPGFHPGCYCLLLPYVE